MDHMRKLGIPLTRDSKKRELIKIYLLMLLKELEAESPEEISKNEDE
jgi:hypothetical protein